MNATPRSSLFSAVNQPRAARPDSYNAGGRNGFGLDDNVYQALLQNRIIFLGSEVKDENANAICAQMLLLNAEDPHKDIYLYINSPGGSVDSGMAIYDTMRWISNDVATVAIGLAASMGQFLLCAGDQRQAVRPAAQPDHDAPALRRLGRHGKRHPDPGRAVAAHQVDDAEADCRAHRSDARPDRGDSDRDRWFTAEQALAYGFIDHVYEAAAQIPSPQAPNQ